MVHEYWNNRIWVFQNFRQIFEYFFGLEGVNFKGEVGNFEYLLEKFKYLFLKNGIIEYYSRIGVFEEFFEQWIFNGEK